MNIPSIRDNPIFYIGLLVAIEQAISGGTVHLTNVIPETWIPTATAWAALLAFIGNAFMTALAAPRMGAPPTQAVAKVLAWLIIPLALVLLMSAPAGAQQPRPKLVAPTGDLIKDINSARAGGIQSGNDIKLTGDPIADLHAAIQKQGQKLIMHLKQSYALAMAKGTNATVADNTSAMCTKALVPIVSLVVNGPPTGTLDPADTMNLTPDEQKMAADTGQSEGAVVQIEKLRILRLSLSSPALNDACGALVQDEIRTGQNLVGKITSLITGAGIAGIGL